MTTISTKFDLGQKAWTIDPDTLKIVEFEVGKIKCECVEQGVTMYLHPMIDGSPKYSGYRENVCFPTREDLMKHLENLNK